MKNVVMTLAVVVMLGLGACKNTDKQGAINDDAQQATIDSMKQVAEKQHIIDSMKLVNANEQKAQQPVVVHDQAPAPQKKKMSGAVKGALIGAGVGAATGAIVSKKKGQGAIIGGLAGAAVGAGTGAVIDGKKK